MAKPVRRKTSSNLQFRRATPADLWRQRDVLHALGIKVGREVTETLGTSEAGEAKKLQAEWIAKWDVQWATWRRALSEGPKVLIDREQWEFLLPSFRSFCRVRKAILMRPHARGLLPALEGDCV